MQFILASSSPRRLDLLKKIGREPQVVQSPLVDETPLPREMPRHLVTRLSLLKASKVFSDNQNSIVLGADTVVACGRRILGKPNGREGAEKFIRLLSGRRHSVYGGITVLGPGIVISRTVVTKVQFKSLSQNNINWYLDSGEWNGKSGAYAIQGCASAFIKQINGSYTNVVGLCLYATESMLGGIISGKSIVSG
ncbi:MAG: septum formation protein Maf [Rhodospirillaceae bacterium]|nr:septum formation protein Maf [Rhodospirillaceae bacterium]